MKIEVSKTYETFVLIHIGLLTIHLTCEWMSKTEGLDGLDLLPNVTVGFFNSNISVLQTIWRPRSIYFGWLGLGFGFSWYDWDHRNEEEEEEEEIDWEEEEC